LLVSDYPAVPELDRVIGMDEPTIDDYVKAASAYVVDGRKLPVKGNAESKSAKAAQGELSKVLGKVLAAEVADAHRSILEEEFGEAVLELPAKQRPHLLAAKDGETSVAGGLRTARSDVTEAHHLDGIRLAIELKPSYRAVGRAIWNRYGDVRAFAVNIHLKFPFAVVGGVQVLPTIDFEADGSQLDTRSYLQRAARRLDRIRTRATEADANHLLEAFGLLAFDPVTAKIDPDIPPPRSRLRWDAFLEDLARAYDVRFGAEHR
jgi:hypothetical protein